MNARDSIGPAIRHEDVLLMRRLSVGLIALFVLTFAFHWLELMYSQKFFDVTGEAQWIWAQHPLSRRIPLAFFATRDFDLPADRYYTQIKVAADPEYTLYFNGALIGARRGEEGKFLDVYDVSSFARTGRNRIVIAARSESGVGGVIAAVDTRPDFHLLATGSGWKIVKKWSDDLPFHDPPSIAMTSPMLLGPPPARRWNYLTARPATFITLVRRVVAPVRTFPITAALPDISVIGGVAVAGSHRTPAVVYDFDYVSDARVQLLVTPRPAGSQVVRTRRAFSASDLPPPEGVIDSFVLAPGESEITDPERHSFRYVMVYDGKAEVRAAQ